jgi:hypothetical protein
MTRASTGLLLLATLGLIPPYAVCAAESPTAELARRAAEVRKKLASTITFNGFDDADTKFSEALAFLQKAADITFEVNEEAFRDEMVDDPNNKPLGRPIPKLGSVSAGTVLRRVLSRMPTASGTTFVVRGGVVEITTRRAASPSSWRSGQDLVPGAPEVSIAFEKRELQEALQEIADATGVNIVLDARAKDKGKAAITATLRDVAVDTVVRILANMADLEVAALDNVLCVTTKDGARGLEEEQEKRQLAAALQADAIGALGFQPPYHTAQTIKERDAEIRRLKAKLDRKQQVKPEPKKAK